MYQNHSHIDISHHLKGEGGEEGRGGRERGERKGEGEERGEGQDERGERNGGGGGDRGGEMKEMYMSIF